MEAAICIAALTGLTAALFECAHVGGRYWWAAARWVTLFAIVEVGLAVGVASGVAHVVPASLTSYVAAGVLGGLGSPIGRALHRRRQVLESHWKGVQAIVLINVAQIAAGRRAVWVATTVYSAALHLPRPVLLRVAAAALKDAERRGQPRMSSRSATAGIARSSDDDPAVHRLLDRLLDYDSTAALEEIVVLARRSGWKGHALTSDRVAIPQLSAMSQMTREAS